MAQSKKRQAVDNAYQTIISGSEKATGKGKEPNPVGVKLTAEELDELNQIAKELGVVRHHVLQYAVRDFLARYRRGEKPRTVKKTITTLEADES